MLFSHDRPVSNIVSNDIFDMSSETDKVIYVNRG